MPEKCFYVSWVDKRTDPWPQWEKFVNGQPLPAPLSLLPADHPLWPGVPLVSQAPAYQVADTRMGVFTWPGIPFEHQGENCRLYLGPTLSALFHPPSRYGNLKNLDRVYLLYQPELKDSPHPLLEKVIHAIGAARGLPDLKQRLQFVPIAGITDPTNHKQIIDAIESWVRKKDPFEYGARNAARTTTRIAINLSPGTPAMHACWLILRWNGTLGKPQCIIDFVQGDGGLNQRPDAAERDPLCTAPIDTLSRWLGDRKPSGVTELPHTAVDLESLGPPYDKLCRDLDHAALLGLPVLLEGERGTGKTFLARYYHERRRHYRENVLSPVREPAKRETKKPAADQRFPENAAHNAFVTVTLSEFGDLENLRDTLFGWAKGSWGTGAVEAFDGLLGEAHGGTLFLDEIHHLDRSLQAALLGPLNSRRYRPKMAAYEIISQFDLVVATNDPQWRSKMADDFRDRVERIVLDVPSFRLVQRLDVDILWRFWQFTLKRRCVECDIQYNEDDQYQECKEQLRSLFKRHPLQGNWRDLQRLADNVLLLMTHPNDGRASPIKWETSQLEHALDKTFSE